MKRAASVVLCVWFAAVAGAEEAPVARGGVPSGSVISRAYGENIRFVAEAEFRALVLGQDLLGGDTVRTGPAGAVGILFADRTVMRLHPNTELTVRSVSAGSAQLTLRVGTIWARAPRSQANLGISTPTAAAAIRGTDWSLSVDGDGTTRLAVYDGAVELSNDLGRVLAIEGEGAVAAPGRPPVKVRVATRSELPQMLFTLDPADAVEPIAEVAEEIAGTERADALPRYRRALRLMQRGDHAAAAREFEASVAGLGPVRASAARWLAAFARVEAGQAFRRPPRSGTAIDGVGAAMEAALSGDYDRTATLLAPASAPPSALAAATQVAIIRDDAAAAAAFVERLKREAPGTVAALAAEGHYRADILGDAPGAAALFRRALDLEPARADLWNALGLAEDAADHPLEAEAAFRKALDLAPADRAALANLAILLLDAERVAEARALAGRILENDPGSYLGLRAKGRVELQSGDPAAPDTLLEALAAQPAAAETSTALAIASYQAGDEIRARQELDAARRLDPNDPIVPLIQSVIALDHARADEAIIAAQEAARLYRRTEESRRVVAADRQTGSTLAFAFSQIGLDGWARFTADRTFDPLSAASLFGEANLTRLTLGRNGPSADGGDMALVQGLVLDPLAASYRVRYTDLLRRPFFDAEISAQHVNGPVDVTGRSLSLQGFARLPAPFAFSATLNRVQGEGPGLSDRDLARTGTILFGTQFGARGGLFGTFGIEEDSTGFETPFLFGLSDLDATERELRSGAVGGFLRLAGRHVLTAYATLGEEHRTDAARRFVLTPLSFGVLEADTVRKSDLSFAGLGYRGEDASGVWFAGIEGARVSTDLSGTSTFTDLLFGGSTTSTVSVQDETEQSRIYLGRRQGFGDAVSAEGLVARDRTDRVSGTTARVALGWRFAPDQWLRVGVLDDRGGDRATLAPISTLGLVPLALPAEAARVRGAILRWDGQFGDRLFLGVEHQALTFRDVSFETADPLASFDISSARLEATTARADYWLGHGVGLWSSISHANSRIEGGVGAGERLPETPEWTARFGLGWVHPSQVRARIEAVWTSRQFSGDATDPIDPVWTVDAGLSWEPLDRRIAVGVDVRNLFDADLQRAWGQGSEGRRVAVSLTARF